MQKGIVETNVVRRLHANRTFSVVVSCAALIGWGVLLHSGASAAKTERDLRAELVHMQSGQDQLLSEHKQMQESVGQLTDVEAKLASAHKELDTLARAREQATAQLAEARQELAAASRRPENRLTKVPDTRPVRSAARASKPARGTAPTKNKT